VENLPRTGGAVVAINHTGYFDFRFAGLPAYEQGLGRKVPRGLRQRRSPASAGIQTRDIRQVKRLDKVADVKVPERAEFRRSARNADEFAQMNEAFRNVYPDVPVPKSVWRWTDSAQHRLAGAGAVRALSVVDLVICGNAAVRGLDSLDPAKPGFESSLTYWVR
jgi:predicted nucleic acid-binding protein